MNFALFQMVIVAALFLSACKSGVREVDTNDKGAVDSAMKEAVDVRNLQQRGKAGEELIYMPNQQKAYTGWIKMMHINGQLAMLVNCEEGKPNGSYTFWHQNGQKQVEADIKDGKLTGNYTEWNDSGEILKQKQIEVLTDINVFKSGVAYREIVTNHMKIIHFLLCDYDDERGACPPNLEKLEEMGLLDSSDIGLDKLTTYWLHGQKKKLGYIPGRSINSSPRTIVLHTPEAEGGEYLALFTDGSVRTMSEIDFQATMRK